MPTDFKFEQIKVSLPLRDVLALYDMIKDYKVLVNDFHKLEADVDALHSILSQMMIILGDIRRGS